jgi:hypothetical protein
MQSVATRRTFVRHMAVGLPVIAGTTSLPRSVGGVSSHEGPVLTATIESTVRDLARLHNEMRRRGVVAPAELRAVAAHTRALGSYQFESNRDVELVRGIRQVIAREGRQTIVDHRPDPEMMRRELVELGFDIGTAPVAVIDGERRSEALDRLARGGLAPIYFDTLFGLETDLAISGAGDLCSGLRGMQNTLEAVAGVMCSIALFIPPAIPDCFAASSTLASIKLLIVLLGC